MGKILSSVIGGQIVQVIIIIKIQVKENSFLIEKQNYFGFAFEN
jgi:hypothetical protein